MTQHEVYMKRCLELALNGAQTARPNPMVGSVVVHENADYWRRLALQKW
jgi:diaminohydroxyphosphoribosylaminopyrimidine deaminase/5-amino-6-(5-phosphoribosylamino)uracil reductase